MSLFRLSLLSIKAKSPQITCVHFLVQPQSRSSFSCFPHISTSNKSTLSPRFLRGESRFLLKMHACPVPDFKPTPPENASLTPKAHPCGPGWSQFPIHSMINLETRKPSQPPNTALNRTYVRNPSNPYFSNQDGWPKKGLPCIQVRSLAKRFVPAPARPLAVRDRRIVS